MKFKKILSGVLASAMLLSATPTFSSFATDPDATGNTMLDAVDITFGDITSGTSTYDDHDWFKFSLPSAGKVNIVLGHTSDMYFTLYNGTDDGEALTNEISLNKSTDILTYYLTAGDYYIHLIGGYGLRDFDMRVIFNSSEIDVENEDNNTIAKATAIEYDGTTYKRQLSLNDSVDYYTFNVAEKGRVTLKFDSPMDNVDWEIYDSEDSRIKIGSFSKGSLDNGISAKDANIMKPGKYTIAFKKKDSYGDYTFSLNYLKNYNDLSVSGIIAAADLNEDGKVDASDASLILVYYAYLSTGGTELDLNKWLADRLGK